ncbi:MAG: hypothetical protein IKW90_12490 [Lachnospiraceae bacterium]|nr:hypothetical protein [Lachnospiraceae bacterium]
MKDNDFKSFETVELLSPIELTPIQGIENPLDLTESDKQKNTNTSGSPKENRKSTGYEKFDEEKIFENEYFSGTQNRDPNRFYYEEERLRKDLQEKKKRDARVLLVVIISILCIITACLSFASKRAMQSRIYDEISQTNPVSKEYDYTNPNIDYSKQDPTYGVLTIDNKNWLEDGIVKIDPEIIEYTSPYERTLYFKVYPKMDEVTVELSVEMVNNGINASYGTVNSSKFSIPKGKAGLIPVTFYINPDTDLKDIVYNINWSAFASYQGIEASEITNVEETPGHISITVKGGGTLTKEAYVVLYKNGKVVSVLDNFGAYYVKESVMDFYTLDVDYDSYEVFY